jgi:signal transduction histidine kinase/DNA-binding response OmpR family regulator
VRKERIFFLFTVTLLFSGLLFAVPQNLSCQNAGFKYLKNHTPGEYGRKPINWTALQDKRGIIYVGNNNGVLEFDGVSWRAIDVPNHSVRSMAVDETGKIYVGGRNEIGFLAPDTKGSLQYKSLLDHLEKNNRDFGSVWRTHSTKEGIYSRTSKFLFRWNPAAKQVKVWKPEPKHVFNASFTCKGKFFIHQREIGLKQMVKNSLEFIRGENKLADVKIFMMTQYDSQKLLIGTRSKGFYIYDGIKTVPFYTEADNYLKEKNIYHGIRLFSGDFAIATLLGGLVIIDSQGRLKEIYNKAFGLQSDNINYVFQDIQGNLWLCLDKGISRIEYLSPFSFFDDRSDLPGIVLSVIKHGPGNDLYAGTTRGLYSLVKEKSKPAAFVFPAKFRLVTGISANCWSLLSIGDSLLAATTGGVFQVDYKNKNIEPFPKSGWHPHPIHGQTDAVLSGASSQNLVFFASFYKILVKRQNNPLNKSFVDVSRTGGGFSKEPLAAGGIFARASIVRLIDNPSYVLTRSGKDKKRLWVGMRRGLVSLYLNETNGTWALERRFENITQEIRTLVEDKKGNLWLGTPTKGVLKVDFPGKGTIENPVVTVYSTSHRLPPGVVNVFMAAGKVMFATKNGIFRFDELNNVFIPETALGEELAGGEKGRGVFRIVEDKNKNIWLHSLLRNFQAILQPDQTFVINEKPFLRLPDAQVETIYPDPGGDTVWFAGDNGLIRYDSRVKKNYDPDFPTLIRKVVDNGELIFDGYKHKELFPIIPYKDRNLRFEFAAPFFENETSTQYQCFLEGYDEDWSFLTSETRKDYTNLDNGLYTFRVRARNVYKNLSKEAVFQFKILLPWYRTWWALLSYILVLFMLTYLIVKWRRSFKLEREKQRLEQIVHQRTKEIEEKNKQLQEQSEKLKEVDKMKSRFFANISHEFRTPLTLILGPLEQMLAQTHPGSVKEQKKKLKLMIRNSKRLLNLINQLLDLSKFESRKMKLKTCRQNIIPFLRGILAAFETLADQTELDLQFHTEEKNITLYFDPEKLEKVFANLLSNAIKFTPGGGRITVSVTKNTAAEDNFPAGSVDIVVRDTGSGIPESQKAHIFEHFYQVDVLHSHEHRHKGSGIGLALTKESVSLHHGEIHVRDKEGPDSGTEFIVRLPMGKDHLEPDEIMEDSESPFEPSGPAEIPAFDEVELEKEEDTGEEESIEDKDIEPETPEKNIVLVVEDNADVRTYIRGALEPLYTVEEAADGLEGIKKAKEIIPDLIISDIIMPEADGYELCRVLKKDLDTSHIPVILLTAKASDENVLKGLETGADEYIIKPFNTKILCARIKNMVDLRRQLQMKLDREMKLQPVEISVSTIDEKFIKNLQDVIEKNLSDPDFNVENLRKKLSMSQPTLYRKIFALSGKSPTDFIMSYRLKRAAQLLKSGFGSITEVAFEVGFTHRTYFTKCFKKKFNQLPSEYQNGRSH